MFTLLKDADDWVRYRTAQLESIGLRGTTVEWSSGPREYPCLADCLYVEGLIPPRLSLCYCYKQDAKQLLEALTLPTAAAASPAEVPGHTSAEFARVVAANLGAIVSFLVDTGICKTDQYEQRFAAHLATVDGRDAEARLDALRVLSGPRKCEGQP